MAPLGALNGALNGALTELNDPRLMELNRALNGGPPSFK